MNTIRYTILTTILSLFCSVVAAQSSEEGSVVTSHLNAFQSLRVDGDVVLTLTQIEESEPLRIEYDLGDNPADKFKFAVKPTGELSVSQARNTKSISQVKVVIYYHSLELLRISYAEVILSTPLTESIANIVLDNGSKLEGRISCDDLDMVVSTESRVDLKGRSKYLTLRANTSSKVELRDLDVVSARVDAAQGAVVAICSGERLDVSAATRSVVKYWGAPAILRIRKPLLGGDLIRVEAIE